MINLYFFVLFLFFATFVQSQTEWFKYSGNPILSPGPESWDIGSVSYSRVIFNENTYKMWYTGGITDRSSLQVGYATSPDGINWEKYSGNPVLTPGNLGSWDAGAVGTTSVIYDGSEYKMWYAASTTNPPTQLRIGYATSANGTTWTKHPTPVLDLGTAGEWDDYWVTIPTVVKDGATYKMWYTGSRTRDNGMIGYAASPDGINWTKHNDPSTNSPYAESDPVLTGTPGNWDAATVWQASALLNNSTFEMWYAGNNSVGSQFIGYATSSDGIDWNKYPNPVLTESSHLLAPSVVYNNQSNIYRMWYTGSDRRINYAATDTSILVDVNDEKTFPNEFSLFQNYPNPFNPSTMISWQSPSGSWQTLKVYDLLGREVATLLDEFKPAGSYEVEFNASELSSGVYFYRMQAGEFVDTKKFILMK